MVTAGVYMIVRSHSIYDAAPDALLVVALVGLATALYGAMVGQTLSDIKGILAASTTTQLGLMFVACGLGAYTVAIFHLVAHAFLKSYLFLSAPSILHHLHGKAQPGAVQAAEAAPSWRRLVPAGVIALLVVALGVAWWQGAPVGLAGAALLAAGVLSVLVTLQHLSSLSRHTFDHGDAADGADGPTHAHAHGPSLFGPALGLALLIGVGAAAGLLPGTVEQGWFGKLLAPALGSVELREANFLIVLAVAGVLAFALFWSWLSATRMERFAAELPGLDMLRLRGLYAAAMHRFWLDEIYERYLAAPVRRLGTWFERIDIRVIDRLSGSAAPASRVDTAARVWEERMLGARAAIGGDRDVLAWLQTVSQRTEHDPLPAEPPRGVVGWLTQTAAIDAAWVEREVIGRANGLGGQLTTTAAAASAWVEREVIGRANGLGGQLTTAAATASAWAERALFGRGINEGVPYAGTVVGQWFERLEPRLVRPAVAYALLAASIGAATFLGT